MYAFLITCTLQLYSRLQQQLDTPLGSHFVVFFFCYDKRTLYSRHLNNINNLTSLSFILQYHCQRTS